ncbi:UDP-N-acetylmuramoyl-tripeptide--D-alanyl-D-alanine ligase [Melghirimyces algeriensis]|uniref:UDP-N-acetylmuramoyl-tripeptide--D-alanyl-D-alanine ligase n=1 Tax=Melghirimyces algeriensis TaxID=910412 RepID=A0A521BLY9_9BACL|nr:UDP-N-acetylmuramoyl-tripeptide--D-alanyl-D-alanine ligase [Melghirimyces algeriensis]SMO48105.1 UDP-N-acetylmuramoyl-tripeptide--D-alanyl-D-alanine ligase [Melghirimyces algeriensis]
MQKTLREIRDGVGGKLVGGVIDNHLLVHGVSTDSRTLKENQLYIPLTGTRFNGHDFLSDAVKRGAVAALWAKDVPVPKNRPVPLIVVEDTLKALQDLAAAYRQELGVKVVGVTGSNGKTTTKDLIGAVLGVRYRVHQTSGNLNNHIGLPLTLLSMPEDTEVAVVEMGMNHKGEIARLSQIAAPDFAVITNIGDAHLEFLGSREAIADAKLEIREGLSPDGILVMNGDEPLLRNRLTEEKRKVLKVGFESINDDRALGLQMDGLRGISFTSSATDTRFELDMMGRHNAVNALLAIHIGRLLGLTEAEIQKGLKQVQSSDMRLENLVAANGMTVINDAYNSSPSAVRATIDLITSLKDFQEKWVLLGDILELGENEEALHREVGHYAAEKGVSRLFTLGDRARWIGEGAQTADPRLPVVHFKTVEEASERLMQDGGDFAVLLVKASRGARLERVVYLLTEGANRN